MKIEFTKEDIEQIRRIVRQEISRFWFNANKELNEQLKKDDNEFYKRA